MRSPKKEEQIKIKIAYTSSSASDSDGDGDCNREYQYSDAHNGVSSRSYVQNKKIKREFAAELV